MSEFTQYVEDLFRLFGPVELRRMFMGQGVFRDGLMFAFIFDDTLYLKADAENVKEFEERALPQFQYGRKGKRVGVSYYQAPDAVLEDRVEAARWARRSFDAALRAAAKKPRAAKRPGKWRR